LLTKWVGETERKIREIFMRARELARDGHLVVIFWDEIESILRTRGVGISSDIESTIVPQFLSEIDGVEELRNVVVIGASNRQDLIDPAVLRPGRFDVKVQIERPDPLAAVDILLKYITADLPLDPDFQLRGGSYEAPNRLKTLYPESWTKINDVLAPFFAAHPIRKALGKRFDKANQIDLEWERWDLSSIENWLYYCAVRATEDIYIETDGKQEWKDRNGRVVPFSDTRLLEAILASSGDKEILYVKDFVSGALLENIVNRAKKIAVKRLIAGGKKGITTMDFHLAVQEETNQMEDLPNTTDPNTWGKIQGRFKERIVNLRTIRSHVVVPVRKVQTVSTGHYL
jgi:SpoVK/Ycf46/Vps4 family AAA+-type ATPase